MSTLFFAAVAVIVLWKLWSVLGSRTGAERPPMNPASKVGPNAEARSPSASNSSNVIQLPGAAVPAPSATPAPEEKRWQGFAEPGSRAWAAFDAMAALEPTFSPKSFLEGARVAYEMVISAFAAGDRKTLKSLVAKDVFDGFETAIADRESRGETAQTTFVSLDQAVIDDALMLNGQAQVTVRFKVKLIHAIRSKSGVIIEGNAEKVAEIEETWSFARQMPARDPNWQVIATHAGA